MRQPLVNTSPMMTRINVTPIIDVALVLVIILLVTAPILSAIDQYQSTIVTFATAGDSLFLEADLSVSLETFVFLDARTRASIPSYRSMLPFKSIVDVLGSVILPR